MATDLNHISRRSQGHAGETTQAERMLRDIAFVLKMTQKVKQAIRQEPAGANEMELPLGERGVLIPC
jgi:hypothetical protein